MKFALALFTAGALSLPAATAQDAPPFVPFFDAQPLCRDGELVGIQIQSNVPVRATVVIPPKVCVGSSA